MPDERGLEAKVGEILRNQSVQGIQMEDLHGKVNKALQLLDGTNGTKGLRIRVDRLEQTAKRKDWWSGAAIVTALSALAAVVARWGGQ